MTAMFAHVEQRLGPVYALVNSAGIEGNKGPVTAFDAQVLARLFAVNVVGTMLCCREAVSRMSTRRGGAGGAIVNLSSIAGLRHLGNELAAYAASKAALQHFSRVVAVRYAPQNVRVNTVIPGLMNTPLVTARLAQQQAGGDAQALIARRHARPPMGRMGDAWDVAYAALYLASDEAKYVTGAEIVVDGGLTATIR